MAERVEASSGPWQVIARVLTHSRAILYTSFCRGLIGGGRAEKRKLQAFKQITRACIVLSNKEAPEQVRRLKREMLPWEPRTFHRNPGK